MPITLENVAAPGATPIAFNAASAKAFANNYAKLASLPMRDRKTIIVLALIYVLANTGANYTRNHAGLIQDTSVYTGGLSFFDIFASLGATSVGAAHTIDPTFSYDVSTLLEEGRDLSQLSDDQLDRIIGFLGAQLGL